MVDEHQTPKALRIEPQIILIEVISGLAIGILSFGIRTIVGFTHISLLFSSLFGAILVGIGLFNAVKSDSFNAGFIYILIAFLLAFGICGVIFLEVIAGEVLLIL